MFKSLVFFYLCVGLYHRGINHLSFSRGSLRARTIINAWRYTYSIRLFLIEAKYRYKGKKYKQKTYSKNIQSAKSIYTRLFHSASPHQALAGSAARLSTRGTSPQQTTKNIFLG